MIVLLASGVEFFFQNCGVQRPGVSSNSSFSPDSHKFLAASTSCSACHEGQRPLVQTITYNFDHKNAQWAAENCSTCHVNKDLWGISWAAAQFPHDPYPASCVECHNNQMPKTQIFIGGNTALPYTHTAGVECVTCHSGTRKFDTTADWRPAMAQPEGIVGSKTFNISVITATFNGSTMIRSAPAVKAVKLEINHGNDQVGNLSCVTCHGTDATTGQFRNAYFHKNILVNPTACKECHVNAMPVGVVGSKGFMRHESVNWVSNTIGVVSRGTTSIVTADCATCHLNTSSMPQAGANPVSGSMPFSGASFHLNTPANSLTSCLDCHAHTRPMGSAQFTNATWVNKTNVGAPPFTTFDLARHAPNVDCVTCHTAPQTASSTNASWAVGYFSHTSASLNCLNCHTNQGVTSTNHAGFNSNCTTCHVGSVARFPNPVIGDWKVNVTGGTPSGVVGEKTVASATTCTGVLGGAPNCVPSNPNIISKGYTHTVNTNLVACQNCHGTGAASALNGKFHTPPTGVTNWTAPHAADVINCLQCHDPVTPALNTVSIKNIGITGSQISVGTGLTPYAGVNHSHALVAGQLCSQCHTAPTSAAPTTWNTATKFHTKYSPATIVSCSECHYKRMPATLLPRKNQVTYKGVSKTQNFTHASLISMPSLSAQNCYSCHSITTALSWTTAGRVTFHNNVTTTKSCNLCHVAPGGSVTSSTSAISFNHDQVTNLGDCASCHQSSLTKIVGRVPTAADWDGGIGYPTTYTIPSHTSSGITVAGYTGTHTTNSNCVACHGTGNYKQITDFDHQGLPASQNSCVSCHLGSKADVSAYIASTATITMKTLGSRHHPTQKFNGTTLSCVGCHTLTRGANTFTNANGIVFPTTARQGYTSIGCGSVNGTTYSCHEGNQRTITIPVTTGTSGKW